MGKVLGGFANRLIYGGGRTGLMGAVADAALDSGLEVVGIIPERFNVPVLAHPGLSEIVIVDSMHSRKNRMAELADAFIMLPGGFGTFDEFFEILTWAQIGIHTKPIGILNTAGYFDGMFRFLDDVEQQGFIYQDHRKLFQVDTEPSGLLVRMAEYRPPKELDKWVDRSEVKG